MRILWHSNAPWASTGYGKQTQLFAPRVAALGHKLALSVFFGLEGGVLDWGGLKVFPRANDPFGNDVLTWHADRFFGHRAAGLTLVLTDIWVIRAQILKQLKAAAWCPVDHEPCQPPTVDVLRESDCIPIAMSKFGARMLAAEGFEPLYVPHGVETSIYRPIGRAEARATLQVPESAFLVGMVAANIGQAPPRKSWPQALEAFARFREQHDDAMLYLHTMIGEPRGLDLASLLLRLRIPKAAVRIAHQYRYQLGFPDEYLANAYSAMDVLLNPSMGEGFGVPIVEAQACGTPVILTDFSSMPELCGAGWLVGGQRHWTAFRSWQLMPDVDEIVEALEAAYASAGDAELRAQARAFALNYDADRVAVDYWVHALAELAGRLGLSDDLIEAPSAVLT